MAANDNTLTPSNCRLLSTQPWHTQYYPLKLCLPLGSGSCCSPPEEAKAQGWCSGQSSSAVPQATTCSSPPAVWEQQRGRGVGPSGPYDPTLQAAPLRAPPGPVTGTLSPTGVSGRAFKYGERHLAGACLQVRDPPLQGQVHLVSGQLLLSPYH